MLAIAQPRSVVRPAGFGLLVVAVLGCGTAPPTPSPADPPKGTPAATTDPTPPTAPKAAGGSGADFTMTAAEFEKEFKADGKAALAKYKGKTVEVSGKVSHVGVSEYISGTMISLASEQIGAAGLTAVTDVRLPPDAPAIGQTIRLQGKVDEVRFLRNATVIEKGPDTAVRTTAEELAKEFTADAEKAGAKCDGKTVVVSGEVAAVRTDPNVPAIKFLELKGDGKTVIHCRFGPDGDGPKVAEKYKPGDKVAFVGSYTLANKGAVVLNDCLPMPAK